MAVANAPVYYDTATFTAQIFNSTGSEGWSHKTFLNLIYLLFLKARSFESKQRKNLLLVKYSSFEKVWVNLLKIFLLDWLLIF